MKQRFASIATVGILLIGFSSVPADAAAKPCKKPGASKTVAGSQYRCVKQKGALRWARVPVTSVKPAPSVSDSIPVPVWQQVAVAVRKSATERPAGSINYDVRYQPSFNPTTLQSAVAELRAAYRPLSGEFPITRPFPVLFFDESGIGWMREQVRALGGDPNHVDDLFRRHPFTATSQASSIYFTSSGEPFKVFGIGSQATVAKPNDLIPFHEAVHVAQIVAFGRSVVPCWYLEGQANLLMAPLSSVPIADIKSFRQGQISAALPVIRSRGGSSAANWLSLLRDSEDRGSALCDSNGLGYSMGYVVMEKLYSDFGEEKVDRWMRAIPASSWKSAFEGTFGVAVDDWYANSAAPYLAQEIT